MPRARRAHAPAAPRTAPAGAGAGPSARRSQGGPGGTGTGPWFNAARGAPGLCAGIAPQRGARQARNR